MSVRSNSKDNLILETSITLNTLLSDQGYPTDPRKQREVLACLRTGCKPNSEKSGPDCYYYENGEWLPAERKSTDDKHCKGSYTGISNQAGILAARKLMSFCCPTLKKILTGKRLH